MRIVAAAIALSLTAPAGAAVVSSADHGFEISQSAVVALPPAEALRAFGEVGKWWQADHTYSGNSANLSMALQPGGCFCERLESGGGVEHMRIVFVDPSGRIVLTGSLGPLLQLATTGAMDVQFKPVGNGSRMTLTYKVAGFASGGAAKLAPAVDRVLGTQVSNFVVFASSYAQPGS